MSGAVDGAKSVACALWGRRLMARGSTSFVADALGVSVSTLRKWSSEPPMKGLVIVISPLLYTADADDGAHESGTARALAEKLDCSISEVCSSASRGTRCHGWRVKLLKVAPFAMPADEVEEILSLARGG